MISTMHSPHSPHSLVQYAVIGGDAECTTEEACFVSVLLLAWRPVCSPVAASVPPRTQSTHAIISFFGRVPTLLETPPARQKKHAR